MKGFNYALTLMGKEVLNNIFKLVIYMLFIISCFVGIKSLLIIYDKVEKPVTQVYYGLGENNVVSEYSNINKLLTKLGDKVKISKFSNEVNIIDQSNISWGILFLVLFMIFISFILRDSPNKELYFAYKLGLSKFVIFITRLIKISLLIIGLLLLFRLFNYIIFLLFFIPFCLRERWS